jgi:hypothetical protein
MLEKTQHAVLRPAGEIRCRVFRFAPRSPCGVMAAHSTPSVKRMWLGFRCNRNKPDQ